jgi:Uma2 family endonuclease
LGFITDIDKLTLYARMGVLEFWRYDGNVWRIYELVSDKYRQVEVSPTFRFVPKEKLDEFLEQAQMDEIEAEKTLRKWIRQQS